MKLIPLTRGEVAIVDDQDFHCLSQWKWHVNNSGYAIRKPPRFGRKERPTIFMHREVLQISGSIQADHVNRNKLDNRRCNLRVANASENMANRTVSVRNKLGVKGVRFDEDRQKYRVRAKLNGHEIHLGRFDTLEEAKAAYASAIVEIHGEFARAE